MIKNGYLIFAILNILTLFVVVYGIYAHIKSLQEYDEMIINRIQIYKNLFSLFPLIISTIFGIIIYLILNYYKNYSLMKLINCC